MYTLPCRSYDETCADNADDYDDAEEASVDVSALDLTTKTEIHTKDETTLEVESKVVASPILMPPPPVAVPTYGHKPHGIINDKMFHGPKYNLVNTIPASEKGSIEKITNKYYSCTSDKISVPTKDIHCSVTNITDTDLFTKNYVKQQVREKIYCSPQNTCRTPKKCAEDFGIAVTNAIKSSGKPLKFSTKHFREKSTTINEIDVDSLARPMRSSTPTPSISASTIVAGNLDIDFLNTEELDSTFHSTGVAEVGDSENDDDDDIFKPYLDKLKKKLPHPNSRKNTAQDETGQVLKQGKSSVSLTDSQKKSYCTDWMQKNSGVSTNNCDAPPSIFEDSVALPENLLNITSVSRNVTPIDQKVSGHKVGKATTIIDAYRDTKFM